jgi:hypothetical protein
VRAVTGLRAHFGGLLLALAATALHAAPARAQEAPAASISDAADPAAAPESAPAPAPARYDLPAPETRWELVGTGLAITGVSYGLALGASYAFPDARMANELRIPLAGPWMAIADTGCRDDDPDCSTVLLVVTAVLAGMDGVLQAGGLGIALEALFLPTAAPKPKATSATPTVRPVPYVAGRDAVGLGVAGTF